jgi:saccharopine dehydrogenase (NAD+, L-lysine-forming)
MTIKPRVLLIGHGTAGKAARSVMEQFGIPCTIWTSQHIGSRQDILDHDVLIHAIRLADNPSRISPPFLVKEDLSLDRTLSVICDISCDMGNPRNTLPIYSSYTSASHPVQNLAPHLKLIAINNLPSMEPAVSSTEFSTILKEYLPELPFMKISPDPKADVLLRSYQTFLSFTQMSTKR